MTKKNFEFLIFSILFISTFNILSHFVKKKILGSFEIFGDFLVYRCAGLKLLNNESPYGINKLQDCLESYPNSLEFFYSPISLGFFSLFGYLNTKTAILVWGFFVLLSLSIIMIISYKFFSNKKNFFLFTIIFLFSFGGMNWTGLITGNISIMIYALISLGIFFLFKGEKKYYYSIVVLASLIKPTYIIFIFLPIFLYNFREIKKIAIFIFIFLSIYLFSYLNDPILFKEFTNNLIYGRSEDFVKVFGGGFGLFSLINLFYDLFFQEFELNSDIIKNIIWITICGLLFVYSLLTLNKKKNAFTTNTAFGLCIITICYPILKHYECFLIIPSLFFLIDNLKTNFRFPLLILMFGIHDKHALILVLILTIAYKLFLEKRIFKI